MEVRTAVLLSFPEIVYQSPRRMSMGFCRFFRVLTVQSLTPDASGSAIALYRLFLFVGDMKQLMRAALETVFQQLCHDGIA
ncbi:MAG TPA: hypothetical protein DD376_00605, partial [Sutterella sp.]|nr:hypothetical protein [Sutterella sp.]